MCAPREGSCRDRPANHGQDPTSPSPLPYRIIARRCASLIQINSRLFSRHRLGRWRALSGRPRDLSRRHEEDARRHLALRQAGHQHGRLSAAREIGRRLYLRSRCSSRAFTAQMTVLADISTAPTAGPSTMPQWANTPAAAGIAITLYPVAHTRFWIILP